MYIEDLDDDKYFDVMNLKFNKFEMNEYVKIEFLEDLINKNYELLGCEKTKEGSFIFTRNHLLSLISFYIKENYNKLMFPFENKELFKRSLYSGADVQNIINPVEQSIIISPVEQLAITSPTEQSTLIINECDYLRGLTLNRTILNTIDVEEIFKVLLIDSKTLEFIRKNRDLDVINLLVSPEYDTSQYNNLCETRIFEGFYSFIDDKLQVKSEGDIFDAYEILDRDSCKTDDINKEKSIKSINSINSTEGTKILYQNMITNGVHAYDIQIKLLKELELLSSYTYKNALTSNIIDSLEEISLSKPLIDELKELIFILDKVNFNEIASDENHEDNKHDENINSQPLETNVQRILTKEYVKTFKNDKVETVALTVIDNIYNFLTSLESFNEVINRNQIGNDLVALGVKKTRKAKGFVYSIEDSGHKKTLELKDLLPKTSKESLMAFDKMAFDNFIKTFR
jgi:hypothetical protein